MTRSFTPRLTPKSDKPAANTPYFPPAGQKSTIFIGTSAIFFAAVNYMKVPAYLALGQFTAETLWLTALFMPLAIISTVAGVILLRRISPARFHLAINLLMIVVGAELIREAIW